MQSPAGIKQLERSFRRLRLLVCGCIYEVTTPRYARFCFDAHVETRSAPDSLCFVLSHRGEGGVGEFKLMTSCHQLTSLLCRWRSAQTGDAAGSRDRFGHLRVAVIFDVA